MGPHPSDSAATKLEKGHAGDFKKLGAIVERMFLGSRNAFHLAFETPVPEMPSMLSRQWEHGIMDKKMEATLYIRVI